MESDFSTSFEFKDLLQTLKGVSLDSSTVSESSSHQRAPRSLDQPSYQVHGKIHPVTRGQVADEVRSIYDSLCLAEKHCYDAQQSAEPADMTGKQWEIFHTLHQNFLQWCIDLIYASNHPAVRKMTQVCSIFERMQNNGIYPALKLLREGSPSLFVKFWLTTYQSIFALCGISPHFKVICWELLGDLAQYRAAVNQATYLSIASSWYSKVADLYPEIGHYQHRLATAQPSLLKQLFYYSKALTSIQPCTYARQSISQFFQHVWNPTVIKGYPMVLTSFIKAHGLLFNRSDATTFISSANQFLTGLDTHMSITGFDFQEQAIFILASNYAALFDYGRNEAETPSMFQRASYFAFATLDVILRHSDDNASLEDIMPGVHLSLAFLWCMAIFPDSIIRIREDVPWRRIASVLNKLMELDKSEEPCMQQAGSPQYLNEDYFIRGFSWSRMYSPQNKGMAEGNEGWVECLSVTVLRIKRCLWLGEELAKVS